MYIWPNYEKLIINFDIVKIIPFYTDINKNVKNKFFSNKADVNNY